MLSSIEDIDVYGILLEPSLNADVSCIISCLDRPDQQTEKQESESESMTHNVIQLLRMLHMHSFVHVQDTEVVTLFLVEGPS